MAGGSSCGRDSEGSEASEEGDACAGSGTAIGSAGMGWSSGMGLWGPGSAQSISERKDRLKQNPAYGPPANAATPDVRKDTRGHHRFRLRNVSSAESLHLSVRASFRSCGLSGLDVRSLHALGSLDRFVGHFLAFLKRLEAAGCDRGVVGKEVCATVVRGDKAKAFCVVEPLHCS